MNAMQTARGRWKNILLSFGLDEAYLTGRNGPCLFCGGRDRWRWLAEKERYICNNCTDGSEDGMALLMRYTGREFADLAKEIEALSGLPQTRTEKRDPRLLLDRVARDCQELDGINPVRMYLRNRGLKVATKSLRYCPNMRHYSDGGYTVHPAMVARISTKTGQRESFHVTYLTQSGFKAAVSPVRKILPPMDTINGAGVYLGSVAPRMLVSEGIETGLAGMQLFGAPAIAALSAGGMERIDLPDVVQSVVILSDNDLNYRGQIAAYTLAGRLAEEGRSVEVMVPDVCGDYLDVLQGMTA